MQKIKRKADDTKSEKNLKKQKQAHTLDVDSKSNNNGKSEKKVSNFKGSASKAFKRTGFVKSNVKTKGLLKEGKTDEKPKWAEMKKEKKQLRLVRRKAKATSDVFELSHKAKLLATQIQRKVVKQEFKQNACKELHCLLKGHYKAIALTHDLSRVIQVLLKHSSEDIKNEITEELLDIIVQMVQSKYAHHSVKRILKYGTDFIRHELLKKFYGHIVSLSSHTISAPVLNYAYGEFATKKEKNCMQQEFYGEIFKNSKDDKVKSIKDAYKDSPEMKVGTLRSCKANIQRILDKNLHDSELLHTVLYDYMGECSPEDKAELISTLSPLVVPLTNSLPGVNAASICVWQGTNKDKKTILKVVKEHVVALSKHKTGYRLLLAIFDSVDDTVLVKKAIVGTLASNLKDIAPDHWGIMTIHWLVKPKDTSAFHPSLISFLDEGMKSGTSKKDANIRVAELREAILPAFKQSLIEEAEFWIKNKTMLLFVVALLSVESSKEILDALAKAICQPDWKITVNSKEVLAVEDAGIHMCLKKMAVLDKNKAEGTLGESIQQHLCSDVIVAWIATNRGCFFILKLIENNNENVAKKLLKKLKPHLSTLKIQTTEGAKLLAQKF